MKIYYYTLLLTLFVVFWGCSPPSEKTQGIPQTNVSEDSTQTNLIFDVTAKQFTFEPNTIVVDRNTKVILRIKSIGTTHGFRLDAYNINVTLEPNVTRTVEFVASQQGTFTFNCSVFCGFGHPGMSGQIEIR